MLRLRRQRQVRQVQQPQPPPLQPFMLTQDDANVALGTDTIPNQWGDVFRYRVPQGTNIVLQNGDQFSLYLGTAPNVEAPLYATFVKLEVRDPAEQDTRKVFGDTLYLRVREFEDRNKIARLTIPEPVRVLPRQWIVIVAKSSPDPIRVKECYFGLLTNKIAVPLGGE